MDSIEYRYKISRWIIIEWIAIIFAACASAYFISPWCFLVLLAGHELESNDKATRSNDGKSDDK